MTKIPGMMLWTDAYLADTGHLTTIQHGAYLLLIIAMWRNGGWLPNDDSKLAQFARLKADQWTKMRSTIIDFFVLEGGILSQKRLAKELQKTNTYLASQKFHGSLGGKSKALKYKNSILAGAMALPEGLKKDKIGSFLEPRESTVEELQKPLQVSATLLALNKKTFGK